MGCDIAEQSDKGSYSYDEFASGLSDTCSNGNKEPQRIINTNGECYCPGNGYWGIIDGENNLFGEGVNVTNLSSKTIEIEGYTAHGTLRGSHTLDPYEVGWFGFWIFDGTYYFKVRFTDNSAGTITINIKTDWLK